jgi:CubicO group peptidase (beta-lactamase class C family)
MYILGPVIVIFLLIFNIGGISTAQSSKVSVPKTKIEKVQAYLSELDQIGFSGSILVAVDGKPVVSKGFGFSDEERKIKNSPKSIHDIGSLTKQFTGAAILKLEIQGMLSTHDKLGKYFKNVPADKQSITIHDLLRHSSGLQSVVGGDFDRISEAEFVEKVFASPLRFMPGERFSYSNIGYSLVALIIEKVAGEPYETYLYDNLFKPAGMEMTGYSRPKFDKQLISVGYRGSERWGTPLDKAWDGNAPYLHLKGNGGILSTTEDLFKWDRALAGDNILTKEAKQKYYFPVLRPNETGPAHYGYGWDVYETGRGTTRVRHNGTNNIFYSDFYRFIDEDVTVVTLSNRWQRSFNTTVREISRTLFEDYAPNVPILENPERLAFTKEMIELTLTRGAEAAAARLKTRQKGIELLEDAVNGKGYDLFEEKKFKEATELFRLNTIAFPRSANAFDSLGEAYLESGNNAAALENYKKSLSLDPENEYARDVIKRLSAK